MTVRSRLTDIALAITGQGASGGNELQERFVIAVERIADCACKEVSQSSGAFSGCLPIKDDVGTAVQFPLSLLNGGTNYATPASTANYARVTFPDGNWILSLTLDRLGSEYGEVQLTAYTSASGFLSQTFTTDGYNYQYEISGGGWVNLAPSSPNYNSWIVSASFCQATPLAPASSVIPLAQGELARSEYLTDKPKQARPFFGPVDWQPDGRVSFQGIAEVAATGIQQWAEAWADILDPTDGVLVVFREIGQFGEEVQQATFSDTFANFSLLPLIGVNFGSPLRFGSRVQVSTNTDTGLALQAITALGGVFIGVELRP